MNKNTHKNIGPLALILHGLLAFIACIALLAVGTTPASVWATTITVTNTADSGAGTLRAALASANNGDTISFALPAPSTIVLTSGELLISNSVTILGPGSTNLAVDGNAASRVFHIAPSNIVTLAGLTITNGSATSSISGGGIYNERATLTLSNCIVAGNTSDYTGGGIYNSGFQGGGQLLITSGMLIGNSAQQGGGIYSFSGSIQISNSKISGNSGGGLYNANGNARIANSCLSSNSSQGSGGAIKHSASTSNVFLVVVNTTLAGNDTSVSGGAIDSSGGNGAGKQPFLALTNCLLVGNSAAVSGGAINSPGVSNSLLIVNNTLSSNYVLGHGGAVAMAAGKVLNSTFNGNSALGNPALSEGGIYLSDFTSPVEIGGCIFNRSASGQNIGGSSIGFISLGYNLCSDDGDGYLSNATDQINTNPMLGPLQDNGGPTLTHMPLPGSPAIDKGKNFSGSTTDERGFPRTLNIAGIPNAAGGDGTDIGAVEMDASLRLVNVGVVSNEFGFNLTGPYTNVVVEASTTFTNWTPVATNTLDDGALRFNDPASSSLPRRFYRARVQ